MNRLRRMIIERAAGVMALVAGAGLLTPVRALALNWNKAAFGAKTSADALKNLGYGPATESKDIVLKAPEIAENGAVVPIEVTSRIAGTQSITIFVDKNPMPLIGEFSIVGPVDAYVATRIKIGESSPVRVFVKAGGQIYTASKEVKVTIGGCGG